MITKIFIFILILLNIKIVRTEIKELQKVPLKKEGLKKALPILLIASYILFAGSQIYQFLVKEQATFSTVPFLVYMVVLMIFYAIEAAYYKTKSEELDSEDD